MPKKIMLTEAQLNLLINEMTKEEIDDACKDINTSPSDAQIAASNYKMGHVRIKGFDISIENPVGSKRYYGKNKEKYNVMKNHYGYFTRSKGKDGDQVDVFIGPNTDDFTRVYVIDQKINGEFDESKVMLGFSSKKEAKAAYFANFDSNWHGFMHITGVSLETFKKWLYRGRKQRQPFADYVEIQKRKLNEERERSLEDIESDMIWEPVRFGDGHANLKNKETGELLYAGDGLIWCGNMEEGLSVVRNGDGKYNYLKNDGTLLLDDWYDDVDVFQGGKGRITHDEVEDGEYCVYINYVDRNGKILGDWQLVG